MREVGELGGVDGMPEVVEEDSGEVDSGPVEEVVVGPDISGQVCEPGARQCKNMLTPAECTSDGMGWIELNPCSEGYSCYAETGTCGKKVCEPGSRKCLDGKTVQKCRYDGSGWDEPEVCAGESLCANGFCVSPNCLPKVMFLVDRSTSMSPNWQSVRTSITKVVNQNQGIQFGLTVFPNEGGFFAGCKMDPTSPHVPLQDNAGPAIDGWFEENKPAGSTPLYTAMNWVTDNVGVIWGSSPQSSYLVLLSDGEDTCTCSQYDDEPEKRAECVAEKLEPVVKGLTQQGVKTFVIGYAYSGPDIELNVIAQNGGTDQDEWIYAGDEATLTEAFGQLISDIKFCM